MNSTDLSNSLTLSRLYVGDLLLDIGNALDDISLQFPQKIQLNMLQLLIVPHLNNDACVKTLNLAVFRTYKIAINTGFTGINKC